MDSDAREEIELTDMDFFELWDEQSCEVGMCVVVLRIKRSPEKIL
jgi:hypothetical protein